MMAKRVLILILLLMTMVVVSTGSAQAQDGEFLGIDAGSYTPGSWITMRWHVIDADMAILEVYDLAQPDKLVQLYDNLPTQGVHDFFLPATLTSGVRVVLWAADRPKGYTPVTMYARLRSQALTLPITTPVPVLPPTPVCETKFYFPGDISSDCTPMRQGLDQATYQPFENGLMLWRKSSGDVWVLEKSGLALYYPETLYGLMADNPIHDTPPVGRSAPANGFGRVWGNVEDVRVALGWALGGEVGYTMTVQYAAEPFNAPYFFMTLPDGSAAKILSGGRWTLETP
ncbi:MAG: hypothetical protein GC204_17885 [Chloroflexi bacterium]|nr:hypothetical protein [Chloroflexota bacterium]